MKPQDIVTAIKKRWWVILVLTLIAALTGTLIARFKSPVYKVEVQMAATAPESVATGNVDPTVQLSMSLVMPTIATATESIKVAEATRQRLLKSGIDIPAETLLAKVSSSAVPNSNGLKISVTDASPTRVAEIANAWAAESSAVLSKDPILLGGKLEITNAAVPPKKPTQPKPLVYLGLGVFLGLVLGFTIVIGWEYFDPHFRSEEETEEMLGVPVLGTIPKKSQSQEASAEIFSGLKASLLFSLDGRSATSVTVAEAIPDGSGYTTAINLAKSVANMGGRTLLVDCDLRKHRVSSLMGAAKLSGIAEILEKGEALKDKVTATSMPNLFLLPAGRVSGSPSDVLATQKFAELVPLLEVSFEWVVVSAPPLTAAVDAALIATRTRTTLVVIDSQTCTRNSALKALQTLRRLQLEPSGVVLTNVKSRRPERSYEHA
jgi:tyrosine-protein kinase